MKRLKRKWKRRRRGGGGARNGGRARAKRTRDRERKRNRNRRRNRALQHPWMRREVQVAFAKRLGPGAYQVAAFLHRFHFLVRKRGHGDRLDAVPKVSAASSRMSEDGRSCQERYSTNRNSRGSWRHLKDS